MAASGNRLIACGMYAFTDAQRALWRELFDRLCEQEPDDGVQTAISFDHDPQQLLDSRLWFGHTCGYPLMTRLRAQVTPFCVPRFDVAGCHGKLYSSRIVVAAGSGIESVADARGRVAAVNNTDSNSGMNVLRHAVAQVHEGASFFARVLVTGGHFASLRAVAQGAADIAAIDCVSFRLIEDCDPDLAGRVRAIADSVQTCGLPFVMPRAGFSQAAADALTARLNRALAACTPLARNTLHLDGFSEVGFDDYQGILEVERFAIERGYPVLQ